MARFLFATKRVGFSSGVEGVLKLDLELVNRAKARSQASCFPFLLEGPKCSMTPVTMGEKVDSKTGVSW